MSEPAALDVSVVILSYDRVHLLERTLAACLGDRTADAVSSEIIVVDNHPGHLAQSLVEGLAATTGKAVR